MAKDHYLPAGFIGRFSSDTTGAYRDRGLWMYNSKADKTLRTCGSAIGYKKGLYNLQGGKSVDDWENYEGPLNRVLDDIAQSREITLDDWVRIAVPFVTGLFVRGKEFNERYENMPLMKGLAGKLNPDNTNGSRILRLHRQLAPVTAARWIVLHAPDSAPPVISNDLGLVLTQDSATKEVGWAIPLDPKTILGLFPKKTRLIGRYDEGVWYANIEHLSPPSAMFLDINREIGRASGEFIFGASKADLETYKQYTGMVSEEKMPFIMEGPWSQTFSGRELVAHENDWHTVACITNLGLSPAEAIDRKFTLEDLDPEHKWIPPVTFFKTNLTEFPSGIGFSGNDMGLNLNLLDDFESHIIHPPKEGQGVQQKDGPST